MFLAWLPMRTPFLRLLAAGTERALWLEDRAAPITRLVAGADKILISSCVSGLDRPLAVWNAWNLHFLVVACVAFALAGPARRPASRLRRIALTLGLVAILGLTLCFAEVRSISAVAAREAYGVILYGGTLHALLERIGRTIIVLGMLAVPAFAFLTSYVGSWTSPPEESESSPRPARSRPIARASLLAAAALGGVVASALILLALARPPDTLEALRRLQAMNPSSPRPSFGLGVYQETQGRLEAAAEAYHASLEIDPAFAEARYGLGNVHHTEGRLQEAEAAWREALRLDPGHVSARENLGIALYEQRDYIGAEQCFSEVIRRDPRHAAAHHNLGLTLLGLERRCEALPHLRRGSNLDRTFARDVRLQAEIARLERSCRQR